MKLSVTPALSQTTIKQQRHNNITSKNPEEYYRRAIVIPLLDRLKQEMFTFTKFSSQVSKLLYLIPSIICSPRFPQCQ